MNPKKAGVNHKNAHYIDSGTSNHVVFSADHLDDIQELDDPLQLTCGGNDINMTQLGSLIKALGHLVLPKQGYNYNQNVVANLLSLGKTTDEFTVINLLSLGNTTGEFTFVMNTAIDDAIYVYRDEEKK